MKKEKHVLLVVFIAFCFTACVNRISEDDIPPPDYTSANLNIRTRTTAADLTPTLPIHIYAFDSNLNCVTTQSLATADDEISLGLPAGAYTVYALTGANPKNYSLPTVADARPTASINLSNSGSTHQELEAGHATITLTDGDTTDLILTVSRIVAQVTATITGLPEDITAVTVSLEPLYNGVMLNGTYKKDSQAQATFSMEKESNGKWTTPTPVYILPGEGNTTVTIGLSGKSGTHRYAYNSTIQVEANYKIDITATYTEATGPDINGSIKSTDWAGTRNITFDFGPDGTQGKDDNDPSVTHLPSVGDLYQDCYVLQVTEVSSQSATLLLVSPYQWDNLTTENAVTTIGQYTVNNISGWQLPDRTQAELIYKTGITIADIQKDEQYLFYDSDRMRCFSFADLSFSPSAATAKTPYFTRAVKVQTIILE